MTSLQRLLLSILLFTHSSYAITCDGPSTDAVRSGASDVVAVRHKDGSIYSTDFNLQIGRFTNFLSFWYRRSGQSVQILINGQRGPKDLKVGDDGSTCFENEGPGLRDEWSIEDWNEMDSLTLGMNNATYQIPTLGIYIPFKDAKFVITDVDGTITESDVKGHIFSSLGTSAHHYNVIPFFEEIHKRGYHIIYLTARSISQDDATRSYLFWTLKNLGLPRGPLLMTPKPLAETLLESTIGTPRVGKANNLIMLLGLFEEGARVVKGAYGNIESDSQAYQDAGIPKSRIYLINEQGHLRRQDGEEGISSYENELINIDTIYPRLE